MRRREDGGQLLTQREEQVLELIRLGYSNRGIAEQLGITVAGARYHVSEIFSKLGVASREEAAAWKPKGRHWSLSTLFWRSLGSSTTPAVKAAAVVGVLAAASVALVLATSSQKESEPQPISGWRVAWIDGGDLWVKSLPDGDSIQLTDDGGAWQPRWSASGEWLSVSNSPLGTTRVMKADGTAERSLTRRGVWSRHDDVLAVSTDRGFRIETPEGAVLQDVDITTVISDAKGIEMTPPSCYAWSPDGLQIACSVVENVPTGPTLGNPQLLAESDRSQYSGLWVASVDGSSLNEVFANDAYSGIGGWVSLLGFNSDGASIAFWLQPAEAALRCQGIGECSLSDGSSTYRISPSGQDLAMLGGTLLLNQGWLHAWRQEPDVGLLVAEGAGRETWTNKRVALIDQGGSLTYLTESEQASVHPAWSPDGEQVAYSASPDIGSIDPEEDGTYGRDSYEAQQALGHRRIWVMDADGSDKRQLTNDDRFRDERPFWSPDGSMILLARLNVEQEGSLWVIPLEGGTPYWVADLSQPTAGDSTPLVFNRSFDFYGAISWSLLFDLWHPSN